MGIRICVPICAAISKLAIPLPGKEKAVHFFLQDERRLFQHARTTAVLQTPIESLISLQILDSTVSNTTVTQ